VLVTLATFIEMPYPPVAVANLFMPAYARARKPQYSANENAQYRAMGEKLRQLQLRELVKNGIGHADNHYHEPQPHQKITEQ